MCMCLPVNCGGPKRLGKVLVVEAVEAVEVESPEEDVENEGGAEEQHFIYFNFIISKSKHGCRFLGLRFILFRKKLYYKITKRP